MNGTITTWRWKNFDDKSSRSDTQCRHMTDAKRTTRVTNAQHYSDPHTKHMRAWSWWELDLKSYRNMSLFPGRCNLDSEWPIIDDCIPLYTYSDEQQLFTTVHINTVTVATRLILNAAPYAVKCRPEMEPGLRVTGHRVTGSAIWVRVGSGHGSKLWPGFWPGFLFYAVKNC